MEASARSQDVGQRYRWHRSDWQLVTWETALPSRLEIKLPADFEQQMETAKRTYHRFGKYSPALDKIRSLIERKPMEKAEILDIYMQALSPQKRAAQSKVVSMIGPQATCTVVVPRLSDGIRASD